MADYLYDIFFIILLIGSVVFLFIQTAKMTKIVTDNNMKSSKNYWFLGVGINWLNIIYDFIRVIKQTQAAKLKEKYFWILWSQVLIIFMWVLTTALMV